MSSEIVERANNLVKLSISTFMVSFGVWNNIFQIRREMIGPHNSEMEDHMDTPYCA